ncbi:energy transducer TonB [Aureibaculum sp. A20]|uniref:Energy transducer TonB n=1 Tax=Aureibaculum flavum TaxID=2795986 RepID=A0ABS0WP29_9FLAO|nr:energy transducer TonB [Aureibaculum flavum]MBJ2173745.1 energy transducer TonB [Aureibaculum flavum]
MNFSKQTKKNQPPTEKFYRSSALFMQLGLVLALLIVYISLEYTSTKTVFLLDDVAPDDGTTYVFSAPPDIRIERNKEPQEKQVPKKAPLVDIKVVPNDTKNPEILDLPDNPDNPEKLNISDIVEIVEEGPIPEGPIPFTILEEAPIFPGCEDFKNEEAKACFTKQMTKFVNRKFDASIAEGLNLSGKQKIYAQFTIGKNGLVTDIKIRAPHKSLEKEALRVIEKLPEMIPGKQRKKAVPVKYTLPIVFQIE